MDLLTPGSGLVLWQTIIFLLLVLLLAKLAWKPILSALKEREVSIQEALDAAEKAKGDMASLKADNEKMLREAKDERDVILREAREAATKLHDSAQADAKKNADKIIDDAKAVIEAEKASALREVKNEVANLSLHIAGRIIRKNLSDDQSQQELVNQYLKEVKDN